MTYAHTPSPPRSWLRLLSGTPRFGATCLGIAFSLSLVAGCQSADPDEAEVDAADVAAPVDAAALQRQQELLQELQGIDQALVPFREAAQQDAGMQASERALMVTMDEAMESADPGVLEARAQFETLADQFGAAQEAGDQVRTQALGAELQGLQARLQQTQTTVMQQEGVSTAIEAFREDLFAWMRAADPVADSLLDRADEITTELEGLATGG